MVDRILDAGREVLLDQGYSAFSTNEVARAAGVSPGSLYQYFADKDEVIDAVIESAWDAVAREVTAALVDQLGQVGPEAVRAAADALLAAVERHRGLVAVVVDELPPSRNAARRQALAGRVQELMVAAWGTAPLTPEQRRVSAWLVVATAEHLTVRFVLDRPGFGREEFLDQITRLLAGYLG